MLFRLSECGRARNSPTAVRELIPLLSPCNVALRLDCPENRSDIFLLPLRGLFKWEHSLRIEDPEALNYLDYRTFQIHSVEMQVPEAMLDQVAALLNAKLYSKLSHFFVICL